MKKITLFTLAAGLCLSAETSVFAQQNHWSKLNSVSAPAAKAKPNLPHQYQLVKMDYTALTIQLSQAGTSFETGVDIRIPTPNGSLKTFRVWNTPVLESELQAQFPEIQTYTGSFKENPNETIKITTGSAGLFLRSYDPTMEDVFAIEPYSFEDKNYYTVAAAADFNHSQGTACNMSALGGDLTDAPPINLTPTADAVAERSMGNVRRTFRIAVACTGEYALAVSGSPSPSVSQMLNIITATINNANGVWEREVSVTTRIVNNNTAVIYTNPTTDPYANDADHPGVLAENQTNHDIFIGTGNYDLGHVFTAELGGLAALASVCDASSKASGVSGSMGPTDIGTVCHEVGHQFGAGHTFTSKTGGCDGNGMATSAVEPGSGTTIMSYNGVCGADNTPIFTTSLTDYYNQFNLGQMHGVLTSPGLCGTAALGQTPVTMNNINARYIIPGNTPFELTSQEAFNTVSSNGAPTYSWEQADLGPIDMVEAQGASAQAGPIFMSIPPKLSRTREFPAYEQLAAGTYSSSGQRLPTVAREMNYKVTARSIANDGWGTHNTIDGRLNIKVVNTGEFRVLMPSDPALSLQPNEQFQVAWNVANTLTPEDSIMTGYMNVYLSLDGGLSFPIILATNVPNTGGYIASAPNYLTSQARIKVKAVGNVYFDISKVNFSINGTVGVNGVDVSNQVNVFPNPASHTVNIKNTAYKGQSMDVVMLNMLGQEVWRGTLDEQTSVNTSNMAKGTYSIHFKEEKTGTYGVHKVILK